ncbi:MAG: sodium:calcium antiporter [Saprospiraceae bacterium]|nr:sodium:calcium antiporter [Saprospiraceae bacterium]MCB9345696.1 sodium:calcium antiporter [Lewinellaceae bacterium]
MVADLIIFPLALSLLLISARYFTGSAETIGKWMKLPAFVIGVFIVGIGTSLPELTSGILSVHKGVSEILPGNLVGSTISNLLLVTGLGIAVNRHDISLGSTYIYIDLHYLLGSVFAFTVISYDGVIYPTEASIGALIFVVYSIYLIRGGKEEVFHDKEHAHPESFPVKALLILLAGATGIYYGAEWTVHSIVDMAEILEVPKSIIALTALSLGTTLPELVVNITAIKQGKSEMAIGNVLGSCIFNLLLIPAVASFFGTITVSPQLLSFSLPVMIGAAVLFYLLAQDKRISVWEGMMFVMLFLLFMVKIFGQL